MNEFILENNKFILEKAHCRQFMIVTQVRERQGGSTEENEMKERHISIFYKCQSPEIMSF